MNARFWYFWLGTMLHNYCHNRLREVCFLATLAGFCALLPACGLRPSASLPAPQEIPKQVRAPETVLIGGRTYTVPPPWRGNRFIVPEHDSADFRRLPAEHTHGGGKIYVLARAHPSLLDLLKAAEEDGIVLEVDSGYRSVRYQKLIFTRMLAEGRPFDDIVRSVAPPGYSQHMLGTAVDFHPSDWRFAETAAYAWLRENGRRFGFEETYCRGNPMKMPWEAWHWNYSGHKDGYRAGAVLAPDWKKKKGGAEAAGSLSR